MALVRPVVLVYQEFASPTATPNTPDLNCLIVGPAYHIRDYDTDKADIKLSANYGTLEAANPYTIPSGDVIVATEPPDNATGAVLDADSVAVYMDNARVRIHYDAANPTYYATILSTAPNVMTIPGLAGDLSTGSTKALPGDRVIVTSSANETFARTIASVDSATQVTFTADLPPSGFTFGTTDIKWRVERRINDAVLDASFVSVTGNQITILGNATLAVSGQGNKLVTYAEVYVAYRSLRQDLQDLKTINTTDDIEGTLGLIDERNPLALGVFVALQNTTTPIQAYAVSANTLVGHTACRDALSTRKDIYAIVPLTADTSVLAMWKTHVEGVALPDESAGRPQKFRVVIGSGELPTTKTLVQEQTDGKVEQVTGTAPVTVRRLTAAGLNFITNNVIPGDKVVITLDANGTPRNGTYTVSHVESATVLEVDETIPAAATANATVQVTNSTGLTTKIAATAVVGLISAAGDDLYLQLRDDNGTFVSSGVVAGDIVEMPADPTGTNYTTKSTWVVATVISDNRLRIVNNGMNSSTVENELPHGVKRTGGALVGATNLSYRIVRTLDKAGQVDDLVAVSQSFNSRRVVLVWPDSVQLPDIADAQPGYYAACAVGGMTAGLPPHQGFTNIGMAGVKQLYNSNTYFTDDQLTELSQGGWYVLMQDTPSALPYCLHQLTTDVDTLETGEFSVVKNFDFVSLFFSDIVDDFLGQYNVNDELLGLIKSALETGIDTLRLRRFAKIGAPLLSGRVNSVEVSPISGDRVVVGMDIGLPKPLNVIELHLVA
jgi:hypothetical protein